MVECIDLRREAANPLNDADVRASDATITMGRGDACAMYPRKRDGDWTIGYPSSG